MKIIKEILALLGQADLSDESAARLEELYASLGDESLAELEVALVERFDEVQGGGVSAEDLVVLTRIADAVDGVRALAGERISAAEETAARVSELLNRVHVAAPETPDEPAAVDADEVTEEQVEEVIAEAEAITEDEAAEPVTAAAPVTPRQVIAQRTPPAHRPTPQPTNVMSVRIRAAGTGQELPDRVAVEDALLSQWQDLEGTQFSGRQRVATFVTDYPESRRLPAGRITSVNDVVQEIRAKVSEPKGVEALIADGGLCGPVTHEYGLTTLAQASRPLRSAIPSYNASRGGISFDRPMTLATILRATTPTAGNAIGVITEAQDAAGTYDKSVQRIECGDTVEYRVDAVYRQLEFGNFIARYNPERVSQFTDLSLAAFARFNEQRLMASMLSQSTEVNAPQELGATRDFLTAMNRAAINYRFRHRMPENAPLDLVLPAWVGMGLLPDDQTNALQSYQEQFEVTASTVERWLGQRGIRVANWFQDDYTTALASGGALNAYPSSFKALLYHPGAYVYVDGGTLDLGVFRDSTLIASNLFRTFMEEFWTVAMWGVEAQSIEFALCANGASAGSVQPTCGS